MFTMVTMEICVSTHWVGAVLLYTGTIESQRRVKLIIYRHLDGVKSRNTFSYHYISYLDTAVISSWSSRPSFNQVDHLGHSWPAKIQLLCSKMSYFPAGKSLKGDSLGKNPLCITLLYKAKVKCFKKGSAHTHTHTQSWRMPGAWL